MEKDKSLLRSRQWFDNSENPGMTALYLERYLNYGLTREELQSGKPIVGIAQTGSDLSPCNRHLVDLASRIRDGIREAGGVPIEFPVHPIQETGKRPTAGLERNLAYLSLVEILYGYPIDGVVLTTGCDKTTPALIMGAATVNIPAIVLSGGPMLDGYFEGETVGSGSVIWSARKKLAAGEIDYDRFMDMAAASAPSIGHCNTMGTALTMNVLAESLGMSLPGCAAIPAPYRERGQMAFLTGQRAVEMIWENLKPSDILTREAFENAIVMLSAIGGSTNAPIHINAIAAHVGIDIGMDDWQKLGYEISQIVNCQPTGEYLGEGFYKAGGVPAVMRELLDAGIAHAIAPAVNAKTMGENYARAPCFNRDVIYPYNYPVKEKAGLMVLSGNLFDSAVLKTSGIDEDFRSRFLSNPQDPNAFDVPVVIFDGPEDYHENINNPDLPIDEYTMLVIRGCGPIGFPGSGEVVNMQPPDQLIQQGVLSLPTMGDGRQSGTSGAPSILNASPESAAGGGLRLLKNGDKVRVDLNTRTVDLLISDEEMKLRIDNYVAPELHNQTPWQELYRAHVGQLAQGACFDLALNYQDVAKRKGLPRHSH